MKNSCGIYGLVDKRQPHKIQYVGKTARTFDIRFKQYRQTGLSCGEKLQKWVQKVGLENLSMVVLEEVPPGPEQKKAEQQWIAWAKLFGPTLNLELGDLNGKNRYNKDFV